MRNAYIAAQAAKLGLDPRAVLAIASHEGLSGGIGDGGHAFGPFQLNDAGGVLTNAPRNQHNNKWAWSDAGIQFALRHIASVAGGLHGKAAVQAITTRFERPADPGAEIRDAMAHYGHVGGGGAIQGDGVQTLSAGATHSTTFNAQQFKMQAGALMMQAAVDRSSGKPTTDLLAGLAQARKAATMKVNNASGYPSAGGPNGTASGVAGRAVGVAAKQIGTPYVWGGEGKGGFDCSGLIQYSYGRLGIQLPRTAAEQGKAGRAVNYAHMKPGDLLVENNGDHVVMYAGNGRVVAAPHTGTNVQYQPLNYFPASNYHARRIVN